MAPLDKRKSPYPRLAQSNKVAAMRRAGGSGRPRTAPRTTRHAPAPPAARRARLRTPRARRRRPRPAADPPATTVAFPQVSPDVGDAAAGAVRKAGGAGGGAARSPRGGGGAPAEAPSSWADLPEPLLEIIFRRLQEAAGGELKPKV
jgi:hypothetical protein